jgi:hypothetical protein
MDFLYLYMNGGVSKLPIQRDVFTYLSGLSVEEMIRLVNGLGYSGSFDKPSLTFSILTGKNNDIVDITSERYYLIHSLKPPLIRSLFYKYYDLGDSPAVMGPYNILSSIPQGIMEPFLIFASNDVDSYKKVIKRLGSLQKGTGSLPQRMETLSNNLKYLESTVDRPSGLLDPPDLYGVDPIAANTILLQYTDVELERFYEVTFPFSRKNFIEMIVRDSKKPKWTLKHKRCGNDDKYNPVLLEKRGESNKDDPNDPTVSYGNIRYRFCYQMSELAQTFKETETGFRFLNPDSVEIGVPSVNGVGGIAANPLPDFPVASIRKLLKLLDPYSGIKQEQELIKVIQNGLASFSKARDVVSSLRSDFSSMDDIQKEYVKRYLVWLFAFGMYNRYWAGPGTPFPHKWNYTEEDQTQCNREAIVLKQQPFLDDLLNSIANISFKDGTLRDWILLLPRIKLYWSSGNVSLIKADQPPDTPLDQRLDLIYGVISLTLKGKNCQSEASDVSIENSYHYLVNFLDVDIKGFNDLLKTYIDPNQEDFNPTEFIKTEHPTTATYHLLIEE